MAKSFSRQTRFRACLLFMPSKWLLKIIPVFCIWVKVSGPLVVTATRSEDRRTMVVHKANSGESAFSTNIILDNFAGRKAAVNTLTLAGKRSDKNTLHEPEKIKPVKSIFYSTGETINYNFPAHSYTVFRFIR